MTTSWTHKPSGTVIDRATIETLVETCRSSPRPHARKAAWRQLQTIGAQLTDIIAGLEKKLDRGHEILNHSHGISREERWLQWLIDLESASDALSLIEFRIVEKKPELVTQRREWSNDNAA